VVPLFALLGSMETRRILHYDGQTIQVSKEDTYELGNYLGGGSSGVVYECVHHGTRQHFALKILHSSHLKLVRSSALSRYCEVTRDSENDPPLPVQLEKFESMGSFDNSTDTPLEESEIKWLVNPNNRQVVAAYVDKRNGQKRELTLKQCMKIFGTYLDALEKLNKSTKRKVPALAATVTVPRVPEKYIGFLRSRQQMCKEICNMQKIRGHENVLELFEVLELVQDAKSTLFLVLELAAGGELFDRIRVDEGCDEAMALQYFQQLLSGVAYCHKRGLAHRDLKPENLLLADHDDGAVLKIADFGLSAVCADQNESSGSGGVSMRRLMSVVGSPHYVAPEVLEGADDGYDGSKADAWSLGVILFALLNGNLPFGKDLLRCTRFAHFCAWKSSREEAQPTSTSLDSAPASAATVPTVSEKMLADFPSFFFPRHLSPQVVDLLVGLLEPDPEKRYTVCDGLQHPWICGETFEDEVAQRRRLGKVIEEQEFDKEEEGEDGDIENDLEEANDDDDDDDDDDDEEEEDMRQLMHENDSIFEDLLDDEDEEEDEFLFRHDEEEDLVCAQNNETPVESRREMIHQSPPFAPVEAFAGQIPPGFHLEPLGSGFEDGRRHSDGEIEDLGDDVIAPAFDGMQPACEGVVKRSTKFTTSIPAAEVLERIQEIVLEDEDDVEVEIDFNLYKLVVLRDGIKQLSVRVYLVRSGTYMVDFIREKSDFFEFRKSFASIRSRLRDIVKTCYAYLA